MMHGPENPDPHDPRAALRSQLSALMDGDDAVADAACSAWRSDAASRADWHAYQLIGDLLRSDDQRADAAADARFFARVRDRLALEPVVLAPQPALAAQPGARARARAWMAPAAVAAGFVAVAGVLLVTRVGTPDGSTGDRTALAPAARVQPVAVGAIASSAPAVMPDNASLVRNAELDRYLEAHRQFANVSTLAAPGGVVRSAATAAPGR